MTDFNGYAQLKLKQARKVVVLIFGCTLLLVGTLLLVLPGPGVVVLLGGLGLLATEFVWARRWLRRIKRRGSQMWRDASGKGARKPPA